MVLAWKGFRHLCWLSKGQERQIAGSFPPLQYTYTPFCQLIQFILLTFSNFNLLSNNVSPAISCIQSHLPIEVNVIARPLTLPAWDGWTELLMRRLEAEKHMMPLNFWRAKKIRRQGHKADGLKEKVLRGYDYGINTNKGQSYTSWLRRSFIFFSCCRSLEWLVPWNQELW